MKVFSCFSPRLECPHLFSHWKSFELFEGNQVVLTSISTTTIFFSQEIYALFSSIPRKTLFVLVCCCVMVYLPSLNKNCFPRFFGQLTDFSLISLKGFCCFVAKMTLFAGFFSRDRGFGLFAGNHNDSNFI